MNDEAIKREEKNNKKWHDLVMGQRSYDNDTMIERVPGGWVYTVFRLGHGAMTSVFVPETQAVADAADAAYMAKQKEEAPEAPAVGAIPDLEEETDESEFPVGSRVVIAKAYGKSTVHQKGKAGKVVRLTERGSCAYVSIDESGEDAGEIVSFERLVLEKDYVAPEEDSGSETQPAVKYKYKFKAGDRVVLIEADHNDKEDGLKVGMGGKVDHNENGYPYVLYDGQKSEIITCEHQLVLAKDYVKPEKKATKKAGAKKKGKS